MTDSNLHPSGATHRRRPRYSGKYPRRFEEKYKEHEPGRYQDTVAKVLASGKTPAGTHRPVMLDEVLQALAPKPGELALDATLGYGGHSAALLDRLRPGGKLIGLDRDGIELPKTEARLRALGYDPDELITRRSSFAGFPQILATEGWAGVDLILADLGVSSMQLDDPARGFTFKHEGPLDMRMNPAQGESAAAWLARAKPAALEEALRTNADEPLALELAQALAGNSFSTTTSLASAIRAALADIDPAERELSVRRVFQALRIAVNDEFGALDTFLRHLPQWLNPGGRVAILTFHSGEDRRVKRSFEHGLRAGVYSAIANEVLRPSAAEKSANPRAAPAKLRWARK